MTRQIGIFTITTKSGEEIELQNNSTTTFNITNFKINKTEPSFTPSFSTPLNFQIQCRNAKFSKYWKDMLLNAWSYEKCRLWHKMKSVKNNRSKKRLAKRFMNID